MSEFNNRIAAQRDVLAAVNGQPWREELLGLSHGAIERWVRGNQLAENSPLVELIRASAARLFFLANKSQEQVTEEYRALSVEVGGLLKEIKSCLREQGAGTKPLRAP